MSNKAAVIHEKGTPDVFRWQDWPVGEPGPGEVLIRHGAIGLNYIDTYNRRGMPHPWPVPPLPFVVGIEGAGTVEAVGDGVTECAVGDRVTYASPPHGAYAQRRVMPAERMVRLPDGIPRKTPPASRSRASPPSISYAELTGCSRAMRCWSMRRQAAWG